MRIIGCGTKAQSSRPHLSTAGVVMQLLMMKRNMTYMVLWENFGMKTALRMKMGIESPVVFTRIQFLMILRQTTFGNTSYMVISAHGRPIRKATGKSHSH